MKFYLSLHQQPNIIISPGQVLALFLTNDSMLHLHGIFSFRFDNRIKDNRTNIQHSIFQDSIVLKERQQSHDHISNYVSDANKNMTNSKQSCAMEKLNKL